MSLINTISAAERIDFVKNLAVMLESGIAVNEALASLSEQARSKTFRKVITRIQNKIETGTSLSEAFSHEEKIFGQVFLSLIRAGEVSGTLRENLLFVADWLERSNDLKKEISAATLYPKFVLSATVLLGGGLAVFILPKLVPLFGQLNVELPFITRVLLAFALFLQTYWLLLLLGGIAAVVAFLLLNRLRPVRRVLHAYYIKVPIFGKLTSNYQLTLVPQILSTLLRSGVPIGDSITVASGAATNLSYEESLLDIRERVQKGTTLSDAMRRHPALYPKNFINIVAVGEQTGSLERSFTHLADYHSKEVSSTAKRLPTIIEPILLVTIALAVGAVALSIIMPIYQLTGNIA